METSRRIACLILLGLCLAAPRGVRAEPAPALAPSAPIALKRGQTIEIALNGQHLSRLDSTSVADPQGLAVTLLKPEKPEADHVRIRLAAATDAVPGDRELRLIGPTGVTRPLRVFVSQYDIASAKSAGENGPEARDIELPATLLGSIETPGQMHQFRFAGIKGRKLIFDVHTARLGSPLDPVVTIHSEDGRELRSTIEHHGSDPMLVFDPPEDATYVLHLRDLQYRGGGDYNYRITAGHIPYVEGLLPSSGRPGEIVEAKPVGYNLEGCGAVRVDLASAAPGKLDVCAKSPLGISNPVPFEVTELPQTIESEPNDRPQEANPVSLPAEVSGHMDRPADEDCFRFHLPYKQAVCLEVLAARYGSPVTPLLQLRNVKGDVIESNDGTADADAGITRELDAGDYVASVRDLAFGGGPGYWYRLKIEPARMVPQDFTVRFMPDAPRLHRGGNIAIWCDVKRRGGFHGDVTLTPENLPAGVAASPITISENASGWFTLAASPDAVLGTAPLHLRASATIGAAPVNHDAEPRIDGREVRQSYLTVLDAAPFGVEAVAAMTPQQLEQTNGQIQALAAKLEAPDQAFEASLAQWEKKLANRPVWTVLNPSAVSSAKGAQLLRQPDGSVLASGTIPANDQYTVTAHTELTGITAVRLEVLSDPRLPSHGPGAAPNGNFVLSEFKLLAAAPDMAPKPVPLSKARADFSQPGFAAEAAIDNNPSTGWAVDNQEGRDHTAVFQTASPVGAGDGTMLSFVLDHASVFAQHNIGRFRIAVTTADRAALDNELDAPANILQIASTPPKLRTDRQRAELASYFRTIDPQTSAARMRLQAMRGFAAPYAEMQRLQNALKARSPRIEAEQERWEQAMGHGAGWSVLDVKTAGASNGSELSIEPDGSIFVNGAGPPTDTYHIEAASPLKRITAIRLEVLPDARLPANGPGRAADGGFILTGFRVSAGKQIPFASAAATIEQKEFPIGGALDGKGWRIPSDAPRTADATFYPKEPIEDGSVLKITLEQQSKEPQHTLGHFRLWVTANLEPDAASRPPLHVLAILKAPAGSRSPEQKRELAAYFRSIAPSLKPLHERLADLQMSVPSMPLRFQRNRPAAIPVPISRAGGFKGDVRITLEGFVRSRDGNKPAPITSEFKLTPLTLPGDNQFGMLTFEPDRVTDPGTRMVVLKAESKIGDDTIVTYSPAFPMTIEK